MQKSYVKENSMRIQAGKYTIHYEEYGPKGAPPLLLLHGWASSIAAWARIIREFSDTFHIAALDFPGCGDSPLPDEPLTLDDYARLVVDFIDAVGLGDPVLIGHSHGGAVTLQLAGTGMLSPPKIVLIDSKGVPARRSLRAKCRQATFKCIRWILTRSGIRKFSDGALNAARAHYGSADYNAAPPVMRRTLVNVVGADLTPLMPNIKAPTLLIWGDRDTATTIETARVMEQLIPDCGLCVLQGAGHFSFVEQPYAAHAILHSFLDNQV